MESKAIEMKFPYKQEIQHDVFVSHSTRDKEIADVVVRSLEENNVYCWYAPRNIEPSEDWGKSISSAIGKTKIFLLIFSNNSNESRHVVDELVLAVEEKVPILVFRIENTKPSGAMRLHLLSLQWLDAFDPPWENHISKLVQTVCKNPRITSSEVKS